MNDERYVAAIEISSSKIVAVVGRMHPDGSMEVVASEQEKGVEGVRYGIIQNLEETSMRVSRVIDRLERKPVVAPRRISGLFVGLSGRSLRSITTKVELNLPDDTEITEEILKRLRNQAMGTAIDSSLEVVDAVPRVYTVGKSETVSPKGAVGNHISATFDLIVCRPELKRNLNRSIPDKLGIPIRGFVVTTLSSAQVVLSQDEKQLGCMLVDMGAETTAVSVYKGSYLRYFVTLPLGGRNITRDITSLNLLEERAEDIKIQVGNAMPRDAASTLNMNGIRMSDVSNLIVARAEEIAANIVEQITYAGFKDSDLPAGIICIGGGAKLNGMTDLLANLTDLPVRRGTLPPYIHIEDTASPISEIIEVTSVLYSGATNSDAECLEVPRADDLPITGQSNEPEVDDTAAEPERPGRKPKKFGFMSKFKDNLSKMFSSPEEDDSDLLE